ncbi:UNVERIFIED_CONTAM: putative serine/threonine-protein kinase SIS8 [Sesamum radiatum]|uniref:Serine/threonine-protein kinase SIS8 n=1 Tax=Sesamum radiatum TaxID=300843 RepID=A0AAW2T2S7_SESRA
MEENKDDTRLVETPPRNTQWWPSGLIEKLRSISLVSSDEPSSSKGSSSQHDFGSQPFQIASQILWDTGKIAEAIPDGFYFVNPVCDFFKRPKLESDHVNGALEEVSHALDNQGIHMLGQIRHSSCHARAILFKVLADAVGLESTLMVGFPKGVMERTDTYKHMSVTVVLNSVELLVDLLRNPGKLVPCSAKAVFLSHLSAGESDSAENDSYDSPIEPNSPLHCFSDKTEVEGPEHPFFRGHGRSLLGGRRHSFRERNNDINASRAVREMNETLKRSRLPQGQVSRFSPDGHDGIYGRKPLTYNFPLKEIDSQKAISLPSSPHRFANQASLRSEATEIFASSDMMSAFNKVLESSKILRKPLLPFEEWNIDFSELTIGTRVGIGFFGEVFRGSWNGLEVGIKVFLEQDLTVENIEDFCNEISILRGLLSIHRMNIVHRDLKSANCLVNKHWTVKICDFGLSRILTTRPMSDSSSAGTPEWMAPELIRNEPFTEKCDIFSLGVIMWELCTLNRPWEGIPSVQVVYAVGNDGQRLEIPEGPLGKLIAGMPFVMTSCGVPLKNPPLIVCGVLFFFFSPFWQIAGQNRMNDLTVRRFSRACKNASTYCADVILSITLNCK